MTFKILDLFSGAGGFSYGLEQNKNFETVVSLDFDKYAIETFSKNFPNTVAIHGDITDESIKNQIINISRKKKVNMIIGGPPCQGFSLKGKNLGIDDPRNFLFLEYLDIVSKLKPEVFIIENVKNLLKSEKGYFLEQIVEKFSSIGYILNYGVLNSKYYGVPQSRERAIIIGSLSRCVPLPEGKNKIVTVREAISDLSYLNSGEGINESKYEKDAESEYQLKRRNNQTLVYNHFATNHSKIALKKLSLIPPEKDKSYLPKEYHGKQKFSTTWSRLEWDNVSPTIDTRFDTPSNGRNSHPFLNRAITPREAARIQSFDDTFKFYGPKSSICKQIGNAVPPLLAKKIGAAINQAYKDERVIKDNYKLYNGNSYNLIKEFQKIGLEVDHIITDPPYNISKENNFSTLSSPRKGVDFGEWDKNFDLYNWIEDYEKILKKDGSMIIFCSYLYISHIIEKLKQIGMCVKDVIIWRKTNPMPRNVERRYVQDMEFAVWAVKKNSKWTFNRPESKPYLRSIYESSTVSGLERTIHPTQKSLKLMTEIITVHTNPNELIMDPFMGSGTTGVASLQSGRYFIGVELEKKYFNIAKTRIEQIETAIINKKVPQNQSDF